MAKHYQEEERKIVIACEIDQIEYQLCAKKLVSNLAI